MDNIVRIQELVLLQIVEDLAVCLKRVLANISPKSFNANVVSRSEQLLEFIWKT